ncbi:MAG: retroviral-like aspartic protease family protein [Bacteroidota bacterium]
MGKIHTKLMVINNIDETLYKRNYIKKEEIRKIELPDVLIDTGATTLALPKKMIEQLDLEFMKTVAVSTATGISERNIYQNVKVRLMERETICECIELPDEAQPLLGVIPLEAMGVELDLQSQKLKFLPYDLLSTYITVI